MILADSAANRWLKGYFELRAQVHQKRMNEIASNTRRVQNLLMRTTYSNGPMRDNGLSKHLITELSNSKNKERTPGNVKNIDDYSQPIS